MNVTQRLILNDPTLNLHNENDWGVSNSTYKAFNDAGVECEVGEFLYSMIRMLKPTRVLETGTHVGIGASYIGFGLKDNWTQSGGEKSILETYEYIPSIHQQAKERIDRLELSDFVICKNSDINTLVPVYEYQMMFFDTEPETRFKEFEKYYTDLAYGGYAFIHDTPRNLCQGNVNTDHPNFPSWPFGNIPEVIINLVKEGSLRPFHMPNPRGLIGFYKKHPDDYSW